MGENLVHESMQVVFRDKKGMHYKVVLYRLYNNVGHSNE